MTDIKTFFNLLKDHDWYYSFSDDNSVWERGEKKQRELALLSKESEQHTKLFNDYLAAVNRNIRGEGWDPPECPVVVNMIDQPETNNKRKAAEGKKMDTSSNVAVKMAAIEPGTWYPFEIYRLKGTPKYGVYWLKIQRGVPSQYHGMKGYENPETFNDTYFLSIWKGKCPDPKNFKDENGSVKVSKTQIKGDLETIGLVVSLIGKKGVNEVNVNPKNPTGKTATPAAEAYNF